MRGRAQGKPRAGTCIEPFESVECRRCRGGGCFAFCRLASRIRVLSKSGGRPILLCKTIILHSERARREPPQAFNRQVARATRTARCDVPCQGRAAERHSPSKARSRGQGRTANLPPLRPQCTRLPSLRLGNCACHSGGRWRQIGMQQVIWLGRRLRQSLCAVQAATPIVDPANCDAQLTNR
jgi:hypothetical protein